MQLPTLYYRILHAHNRNPLFVFRLPNDMVWAYVVDIDSYRAHGRDWHRQQLTLKIDREFPRVGFSDLQLDVAGLQNITVSDYKQVLLSSNHL